MSFNEKPLRRLLIIGASARAAATSATRSGYQVQGVDLFNDRDLNAIAECRQIRDYPDGITAIADKLPASPWLYTGALENHPQLVARISERHQLLGNCGPALSSVRNPLVLFPRLRECGLVTPAFQIDQPRRELHRFLRKPIRSAAGHHIQPADRLPEETDHSGARAGVCFYQERIDGSAISLIGCASNGVGQFVGATTQLVGSTWCHAKPFAYCGSIGPLQLPDTLQAEAEAVIDCIASEFQLRGLFGVDAIVREERIYPIEVNPRFCASVEVIEISHGISGVEMHYNSCATEQAPDDSLAGASCLYECVGKAIVFAPRDIVVDDRLSDRWFESRFDGQGRLRLADVPTAGQTIPKGHPVLTVFGYGDDERMVESRLRLLADVVCG